MCIKFILVLLHMQQGPPGPPATRFPPATAEAAVIKLILWAMWERHRALNALAGDNVSAVRIDRMGALRLLAMPAARRHHGELCHLVNERGETGTCGEVNEWYYTVQYVSFCCSHQRQRQQRAGTRGLRLHGAS